MKPSKEHLAAMKEIIVKHGNDCSAFRVFVTSIRLNKEERAQILDIKTCTRSVVSEVSSRLKRIGVITKTNLGDPTSNDVTHWVLTEWGLIVTDALDILSANNVTEFELKHNNDMVDFINNLKNELVG